MDLIQFHLIRQKMLVKFSGVVPERTVFLSLGKEQENVVLCSSTP